MTREGAIRAWLAHAATRPWWKRPDGQRRLAAVVLLAAAVPTAQLPGEMAVPYALTAVLFGLLAALLSRGALQRQAVDDWARGVGNGAWRDGEEVVVTVHADRLSWQTPRNLLEIATERLGGVTVAGRLVFVWFTPAGDLHVDGDTLVEGDLGRFAEAVSRAMDGPKALPAAVEVPPGAPCLTVSSPGFPSWWWRTLAVRWWPVLPWLGVLLVVVLLAALISGPGAASLAALCLVALPVDLVVVGVRLARGRPAAPFQLWLDERGQVHIHSRFATGPVGEVTVRRRPGGEVWLRCGRIAFFLLPRYTDGDIVAWVDALERRRAEPRTS